MMSDILGMIRDFSEMSTEEVEDYAAHTVREKVEETAEMLDASVEAISVGRKALKNAEAYCVKSAETYRTMLGNAHVDAAE